MPHRTLGFVLVALLTIATGTRGLTAQNALNVARLEVGMVYVDAWDTNGPGLEARLTFGPPEPWLGLHHTVTLVANVADLTGMVSALGPYDRSFASAGVAWRSTFVNLDRYLKPYVLVPGFVARSRMELGEEFDRAYLSSSMRYRDLPDWDHHGTNWGLCFGLGSGVELDVSRLFHFDLSGALMYPTLFEDRRLMKTIRFGFVFGGEG